jgi:tetratricopeptide (TPR) repeat protein
MSSGRDDPQMSVADLDRQIVELGHAIALNPNNAKTYRDRGLLYGRKRDYGHAIADFEKALSLSPADARAYYLRGLALHRNGEPNRAIADFDKAIELDPPSARSSPFLPNGFASWTMRSRQRKTAGSRCSDICLQARNFVRLRGACGKSAK